jgi:NADH-quinone oxidoreductase subunit M
MTIVAAALIIVPIAALLSFALLRKAKKLQWLLFFAAAAFFAVLAFLLYGRWGSRFALDLGIISLNFVLRRLPWLFFAFSSALTVLISIFSLSFNDTKHASPVAPLWMLLLTANIGIFFSADWITFLISWEIMGWTSFYVISAGRSKSFQAGIYYYGLSLIGTACLLAAVFLIRKFTGTYEIVESIAGLKLLWASRPGLLYGIIILLTVTFLAKSAVGPFYMWPAMAHAEAPDDFSAFLSGIMIKYGIFGFITLIVPLFGQGYAGPAVQGTPLYLYIIGWIGAFTAVWATLLAIRENDMKRLMAYSTVGNMGYIMIALSVNTAFGISAAVFHVFNHMIFKGSIFLSLASVKFRTGERQMHRLGGMAYRMPVAFFAFLIGIIAAAGIPPMSGFASKWMMFQTLFSRRLLILAVPAFFASTAAFMYLYRGLHSVYLGQLSPRFKDIKPAPPLQSFALIVTMLAVYAVGTFPGLTLLPLGRAVTESSAYFGFTAPGALPLTLNGITGTTSSVNLTVVSAVFMAGFIIVLILYLIGKSRRHVEALDTYTAGESPEDWKMTPEQYHYAYHFYEPFEKMMNPLLNRFSFERGFNSLRRLVERFSAGVGRWTDGGGAGLMLGLLSVIIILIAGVVLW